MSLPSKRHIKESVSLIHYTYLTQSIPELGMKVQVQVSSTEESDVPISLT